jgi:hypothetical protein
MDADGNILIGSPSKVQVYHAPAGFHVDFKKIQDAAKDLSGLLPTSEDDKKKWLQWGVPQEVVDFLAKIAGVASIMATAVAVYAWAVGLLVQIMGLVEDGMKPDVAKAFQSIKNQLVGMEQIQRAENMIALHAQFDGSSDQMSTQLNNLVVSQPDGDARAGIFAQMQAIVNNLAIPLSQLRDQDWSTTYDPDAHKGRGFIAGAGLLFF